MRRSSRCLSRSSSRCSVPALRRWLLCTVLLSTPFVAANPALAGEAVMYEIAGAAYEGYFAPANTSKGPARGLVLIIHDWDGLTEYEVQRADMLAELGYHAFAADLFGAGIRPTRVEDRRQHTGELYTDREKMRALMRGALDAAAAKGADRTQAVAMGYCFGGAAVLELARSGEPLRGFATFHGGLQTPEGQDYTQTAAPVAVYHGTADSAIPMSQFAALAEALEEQGIAHEMISYGGAPHAFTVFGSDRYREQPDQHSWQSFLGFLQRNL